MNISTSALREADGNSARAHVEALLEKYPNLSAAETAEILHFLKKGPQLENALMTANDKVRAQLDRFRADHVAEFALQPKHYAILFGFVMALVLACILLWDAGI